MNEKQVVEVGRRHESMCDPAAEWIVTYGRQQSWGSYIVGQRPPLTHDITVQGWRVGPVTQADVEAMPEFALKRMAALTTSSSVPLQWALFHEPSSTLTRRLRPSQQALTTARNAMAVVAPVIGVGAAIIAGVAIAAYIISVLLPVLAIMAVLAMVAMGVDPILVAITPDHTWVAVAAWRATEDTDAATDL